MRAFMGVHKYASIPGLYGDMAWKSPVTRHRLEMIRLWIRIVEMDNSRLTKRIYVWDKRIKKSNWSNEVKLILKDCELEHLYTCENPLDVVSKSDILKVVEEKLMLQQIEKWTKDKDSQTKLRFYRLFKKYFTVETFVTINMSICQRYLLSQLRYGILPLKIETGRYVKLPLCERLCNFCNEASVESEIHFLFECKQYEELREGFYNDIHTTIDDFSTLSNEQKLNIIFSKSSFIRKFASYLQNCYRKRSSILYK